MNKKPTILIIFGTSGDLVRRYILPAILDLKKTKKINNKFEVIGITRQKEIKLEDLIEDKKNIKQALKFMMIHQMDGSKKSNYLSLINEIKKLEKKWHEKTEIIIYFSLPPEASSEITQILGEIEFFKKKKIKLLLEKPFGQDLETAKIQIKKINKYYNEKQIYRVDHYLFKKIINKINNKKLKINNKNTESITINALENIDVSHRINFYDQVGALKDMIQSHLLEILAYTLNPKDRLKTLEDLKVNLKENKFGQYIDYRNHANNHQTKTETFASINLCSKNKNLNQIKIYLNTGKALNKKETSIKIKLKNGKTLVLKEDINKKNNSYKEVLLNAVLNNKKMFINQNEVLKTWEILSPILNNWKKGNKEIFLYPKGSKIQDLL